MLELRGENGAGDSDCFERPLHRSSGVSWCCSASSIERSVDDGERRVYRGEGRVGSQPKARGEHARLNERPS